ncbi:peptidylprolyl isomerase [Paenibacillus harenae]|uniref:peptidylprolyl isomerase n=1 Tax=Paenibacillus harenae TaxID=306543 RepID=A0ABT9U613_PAEHA|nr:peptidylprolyl isomerase [Paenibacillus harenae]MDQ0114687.1 foldase protein PrsA [Paenibacillus harenae]
MNNNESQSKKDEEKATAAKEEQLTQQNEQQDELFEQAEGQDDIDLEKVAEEAYEADAEQQAAAAAEALPLNAAGPVSDAPKAGGSKGWMIVSAVLAVALVIVLIKPPFGSTGGAVASVNGQDIPQSKLYDALVDAGGPSTLNNLITEELIQQEADAAGVKVTDDEVTAEIDKIKASFETPEQFTSTLSQYGMTEESLTRDTKFQLTVSKILEPKTDVTDEEISQYFEANKDTFTETPTTVRASHILVATQEEADAILAQLKGGADFAAIAKEKSTDTASAANGGDLDFFKKADMDPAFGEAAFTLKVGELSGVVQSSFGFHIIKKTDEKLGTYPTLDEKKEEIRKTLVAQEAGGLSEAWLTEIREKAKITNTMPTPTPAPAADTGAVQ